jgi:hypothetical protein
MKRKTKNMIIGAGVIVVGAIGTYVICKKIRDVGIKPVVDFHQTATINADGSITYSQYIPKSFMKYYLRRAGRNDNFLCVVATIPKDKITASK